MAKTYKSSKKFIIHTDGGSRGNPGNAAIGYVINDENGSLIKEHGEKIGMKTNNEAEYQAVVSALKKLKALVGKENLQNSVVNVFMDSELVVKQLNGKYKLQEKKLFPLFIQVWNYRIEIPNIIFHNVPREQNREADRLVNEALDAKESKTLF